MTAPGGRGDARGAPPEPAEAARRAMLDAGFDVGFPAPALAEAGRSPSPPLVEEGVRDLRALLWSSIDNATTRDLDQVEYAEPLGGGSARLLIGIADVDSWVPRGSALDDHAGRNTTSVYTAVRTFPMLPERLSTDLTSLVGGADRPCVVVDMVVDAAGAVTARSVYRALVHNHAQLVYETVGDWLAGTGEAPPVVAASAALAAQLRLQNEIAVRLRGRRERNGALELETVELRPVVRGGEVVDLAVVAPSPARELISDFMIAANTAMAAALAELGLPSLRRVVRTPRRWNRIVQLAEATGHALPAAPSAEALAGFLRARRAADPAGYVELSLAVVKLLGAGEYAVQRPGGPPLGHFGLAVPDYTHATAPNRRYADLVTQRLVKAALAGAVAPYTPGQLDAIAARCTEREDAAKRVERLVSKQAAAAVLAARIGADFDAVVTGVKPGATYVRLVTPPVDGRVVRGEGGLDVGDRVRVRLLETDVRDGFIDFARV